MLPMSEPYRRPFEAAIYNREVRIAVKNNLSHAIFGDHWADRQLHDVLAYDENEARTLIAERFPAEQGFVIEGLFPAR